MALPKIRNPFDKTPRRKPTEAERNICSNKKRYSSQEKVKRAVRRVLEYTDKLMNYYKCPVCYGYHLTTDKQYLTIREGQGKKAAHKYLFDKNHRKLYPISRRGTR